MKGLNFRTLISFALSVADEFLPADFLIDEKLDSIYAGVTVIRLLLRL